MTNGKFNTYGTMQAVPANGTSKTSLVNERNRSGRFRAIIFALCSFLAALAIWVYFMFWIILCYGPFNPPFPVAKWSDFKNQSFAVGFDLTAGYGTAALGFNNGTVLDVAWEGGTHEYNEVLARLSLESSAHPTPPYYNCGAQTKDLGRQWLRYIRKRLGVPASADVAALAHVLKGLKAQTDNFLEQHNQGPLEVAFITIPYLPALYNQDLVDAAEHVNVQLLTLPWYIHRSGDQAQWPVSEINTAFAGNGLGIDNLVSVDIPSLRHSVPKEPWSENVFSVLFTKTALTAHVTLLTSAPHFYAAGGIVNFTLGLSSLHQPLSNPKYRGQAELEYWSHVRLALRSALYSYLSRGQELGRVVVYGESAHDETFNAVLKEEVLAAQLSDDPGKRPQFISVDPMFAGARGAAIFARFCRNLPSYQSCFPDLKPRAQGW